MSTIFIAIYAALISTAVLGWNVYSWVQSRRTRLSVNISNAIMGEPLGTLHVLAVQATNRGDHSARVTSFGLEANDDSGRQLVFVNPVNGSTLPGPIAPHDSGTGYQPIDTINPAEVDLRKPVVAFVQTADNGRYRSKPARLVA
jgi:hypothetical protein